MHEIGGRHLDFATARAETTPIAAPAFAVRVPHDSKPAEHATGEIEVTQW